MRIRTLLCHGRHSLQPFEREVTSLTQTVHSTYIASFISRDIHAVISYRESIGGLNSRTWILIVFHRRQIERRFGCLGDDIARAIGASSREPRERVSAAAEAARRGWTLTVNAHTHSRPFANNLLDSPG